MQQLWDLFHPQCIPKVSRGFNPITHGGNLLLKGILCWLLAFYCLTCLIYNQSFPGLPPKQTMGIPILVPGLNPA